MLLDDLLSRDAGRVLDACAAVVHLSDPAQLDLLAARVSDIEAATLGLDFGGESFDDNVYRHQALRTLRARRAGACRCLLYQSDFSWYDPKREARSGHVEILWHSPDDYFMTFHARCLRCGQPYEVEQGEHFAKWWKWRLTAEG